MEKAVKHVGIIKDWDFPNVYRQTPQEDGVWNGIRFSVDAANNCDLLVALNNRFEKPHSITVKGRNVWALMQEPYVKGVTDWMAEKHNAFDKVFSHYLPNKSDKYTISHPAIPWHVNFSFRELVDLKYPYKNRPLSWIVGNVKDLPGHMRRWRFLQMLRQNRFIDIDLFGKAVRYIKHKNEGLLPYRYSLAVENTCCNDYWTEKFADCILSWTIPIYFGCPNLETYFPPKSFIRVDINDPKKAIEEIRDIVLHDDWEARLVAVAEARELILHRYQLFPHLCRLIELFADTENSQRIVTIPTYKRSLKAYSFRRIYKVKKALHLL